MALKGLICLDYRCDLSSSLYHAISVNAMCTVTRYALNKREPLAVEHEHFRDAIFGQDNQHVTMREALTTMRVVQGMLDSAESGKTSTF